MNTRHTVIILVCRAGKRYLSPQFILMLRSFMFVCVHRKWQSAERHVINGGCPGLLIGLCNARMFIQIIQGPFGNAHSDWKGHLSHHWIQGRRACQPAIWHCPSQSDRQYSAVCVTWSTHSSTVYKWKCIGCLRCGFFKGGGSEVDYVEKSGRLSRWQQNHGREQMNMHTNIQTHSVLFTLKKAKVPFRSNWAGLRFLKTSHLRELNLLGSHVSGWPACPSCESSSIKLSGDRGHCRKETAS